MHRSKRVALMLVLGAILVGGVLGFSADRLLAGDRPCHGEGGRRHGGDWFARELDLTDGQRASVDSILDAKHRQIADLLAPMRPQLDSISAGARAGIASHLTADQRARFETMQRRSSRRSSSEK